MTPESRNEMLADCDRWLAELPDRRAELFDFWLTATLPGEPCVGPNGEALHPLVTEQRQALVESARLLDQFELDVRRLAVKLRAGVTVDGGLVDLIARYRPPSWN